MRFIVKTTTFITINKGNISQRAIKKVDLIGNILFGVRIKTLTNEIETSQNWIERERPRED